MRNTLHLACVAMLVLFTTSAWATTLSQARHVFVEMANDAKYAGYDDAEFDLDTGAYDDFYYIKADGGGLNQLHITNAYASEYGQDNAVDAVSGSASGSFWISTTGGRGYNDNIILMISVKPDGQDELPSNLSINIKTSGYDFDPGDYTNATYDTDVIDVTFDETDFTSLGYGEHTYKPGPNGGAAYTTWMLPLYTSQSDFTNGEYLLFVDLNLGNIKASMMQNPTEGGSVKVEYSISGLTTAASFNAYAWCEDSNQGQGINWTTDTYDASGTSSYRLTYAAP